MNFKLSSLKSSIQISAFATVVLFSSCTKKPIKHNESNDDSNGKTECNAYMASLPLFDMETLPSIIKKEGQSHSKTSSVWGCGTDDRVYRWNGSSWDEPAPAARLKYVDVPEYSGSVWGIGGDQRIYKWNGTSWAEPNANARLYQISSFSGNTAIGRGSGGFLYITSDGGVTWQRFTMITEVIDVSVGNTINNFCWVVKNPSGTAYNYLYNLTQSTGSWTYKSFSNPKDVEANHSEGAWCINNNNQIYRSLTNLFSSFSQPNSSAGLLQISAYGDDVNDSHAWGIGGYNHIYRTTNGGASWDEPNPAARLRFVSCGYE